MLICLPPPRNPEEISSSVATLDCLPCLFLRPHAANVLSKKAVMHTTCMSTTNPSTEMNSCMYIPFVHQTRIWILSLQCSIVAVDSRYGVDHSYSPWFTDYQPSASHPRNIAALAFSRYNSQPFDSYKLQPGLSCIQSLVDVGSLRSLSQTGGPIDLDAKPRKCCFARVY